MTIHEYLDKTLKLHSNLDKNDLKLALMHVFNIDNYTSFNQSKIEVEPKLSLLNKIIKRLLINEPIQYILEEAYFYDSLFKVNKNVLIPRPETEELVDIFIKDVGDHKGTVLDIGTGSGVIALTIKKHTMLEVYASDISLKALKVAKSNDVNNEVTFIQGDLLIPFLKSGVKVDYIIANLPYIKKEEILDAKVKDFEPHKALFNNEKNIYTRFFKQLRKLNMNPNGIQIYLEFGTNQAREIKDLATFYFAKNATIDIVKDMQGKERFIVIKGTYGHESI